MAELIVKNVAFNYSPVEDRVLLKCLVDGVSNELWLTQRMFQQLLPALTKWLSRSGFGTAQTQDFMRSTLLQRSSSGAQAAVQSEALRTDLKDESGATESSASEEVTKADQKAARNNHAWLCTKANLTFGDQRLRMKLESEFEDETFVFSMTLLEASHFLMVLRDSLKKSDWLYQWPTWLPLVEEEGLPKDTSFLH